MPIYEYRCSGCQHAFEALVFGGKTPECPECGGTKLEKQFSVFGVGGSSGASMPDCPMPSGGG